MCADIFVQMQVADPGNTGMPMSPIPLNTFVSVFE